MMATVSAQGVRRALRTVAVAAIAFAALGLTSVQILVGLGHGQSEVGLRAFETSANVVVSSSERARARGISPGDRIDYSLMPTDERYGRPGDGLRAPPPGTSVSYVVEHNGRRYVVPLTAAPLQRSWRLSDGWSSGLIQSLLFLLAWSAIVVVLVLLGSALALIKPTAFTAAFLLFVAQFVAFMPEAYYFLPPLGYAAVMVVSDTLAGLGAVGFLALAFYLDPRRPTSSRLVMVVGAMLLAIIVVPVATSDVSELMVGSRPVWPVAGWASFSAVLFCYLTGIVFLLKLTATTNAPSILRLLAGLLAVIGTMTIFYWTPVANVSWYFANLPAAVMNRTLWADHLGYPLWWGILLGTLQHPVFFLKPLGLLLAFYLIVRAKIVDTGPVLSRIVAYVVVVLLVITVFSLANIAFAQVFSGYRLLIPIEIFAALAIGYWVSGLRDVAGCLSLASADAWGMWAKGHQRDEHDALIHALRLAERTRQRGIVAEVRAQMAFSAWRDGDDDEFERNIESLTRLLRDRTIRGLRGFVLAATSDDAPCFRGADLLEWKARAALLLCARTDDTARVQEHAADALANAERAGLASLQVLALVAVAESRADDRDVALEQAHAIARDAGWPALSKSILALRANARDIGILQPFVEVRLRKSRPARPLFEVAFFNGELRKSGGRVPLSAKELELLLSVATARSGINDNDLIDTLWPESDGDAARNAFRVCLHRLRKNAGDARIVARVGKGYVLHPWADVDLWRFQSFVATCRESRGREGAPELRDLCDAIRAGEGQRAMLGEWFYRFEQMLQRKLDEAERALGREVARAARS